MSTNCLVTKLKGTVSGDFPKFGESVFDFSVNALKTGLEANTAMQFGNNAIVKLSAGVYYAFDDYYADRAYIPYTGNEYIESTSTEIEIPANKVILTRGNAVEEVYRQISPRYDCKLITLSGISVDKDVLFSTAKYSEAFDFLSLINVPINTTTSEIVSLFTNPETARLVHIEGINSLAGNIADLGCFINSEWIVFKGLNSKYEDLFVSLLQHGAIREKMEIQINGTFNEVYTEKVFATFGSNSITVYASDRTTVLGTYNGSSWTYNS